MRNKCPYALIQVKVFILTVLRLAGYYPGFFCLLLRILWADPNLVTVRKVSLRAAPAMPVICHSSSGQGRVVVEKRQRRQKRRDPLSFLFVSFYSIFMNSKYIKIHINMHPYMYTYHAHI